MKTMPQQKIWLDLWRKLRSLAFSGPIKYGDALLKQLEELEKAIETYTFKVYLIGPFSCGKSTLLNKWMGVDLLPKGISPETAVATELHYAENEKTVLISLDENGGEGTPEELPGVSYEQMAKVTNLANAGKLARVCLFIDNPKLKDYSDICIVDLPGLSSACRAHELAINRFVMEKSIGVFCIPMPAGTIQQDALEFLQDMERYRADLNLLLTKADECSDADRLSIQQHISETVRAQLGIPEKEFHVGVVSKDDVTAFTDQLDGLKAAREQIFENRFRDRFQEVCTDLLAPIKIRLDDNFSSEKADQMVAELEESENKTHKLFDDVSSDIVDDIPGAINRVIEKVKDIVIEKAGGWFSCMKTGHNCNADIGATIQRSLMYYANEEVHDVCDKAARRVLRELKQYLAVTSDGNISVKAVDMGERIHSASSIFTASVVGFAAGAAGYGTIISTIGAAIGSVVPVVGTGIGFVIGTLVSGVIGGIVGGGAKVSENKRGREELQEKLEMQVESLRDEVSKYITAAIDDFKRRLEQAVDLKLKALKEQVEQAKAERDRDRTAFDQAKLKMQEMSEGIQSVLLQVIGTGI